MSNFSGPPAKPGDFLFLVKCRALSLGLDGAEEPGVDRGGALAGRAVAAFFLDAPSVSVASPANPDMALLGTPRTQAPGIGPAVATSAAAAGW